MQSDVFQQEFYEKLAVITEVTTYVVIFSLCCTMLFSPHDSSYNYAAVFGVLGMWGLIIFVWHRIFTQKVPQHTNGFIETFVSFLFIIIFLILVHTHIMAFMLLLFVPLTVLIGNTELIFNLIILIASEICACVLFFLTSDPIVHMQLTMLMLILAVINIRTIIVSHLASQFERLSIKHQTMVNELKDINKYKDEFVYLTTHKLRTPTTVIRGYIDLLQHDTTTTYSDKAKSIIESLEENTRNLTEIIEELLDISQLETGKIHLHEVTFDLDELIQDVLEELSVTAKGKHVSLRFIPQPGKPVLVTSDKQRFREIIVNLVDNAIKYSNEGGAVIVFVKKRQKSLEVSVKDNGIGIPVDDQSKIFQKFFRARNVYQLAVRGTGLGLYTVYKLVDILRGYIQFSSEENRGTTFRILLPIKNA